MTMYPRILENQINELNRNLENLEKSIKNSSESSNSLQKRLVFWTKVMAGAIIVQAIAIGVQIYLTFLKNP